MATKSSKSRSIKKAQVHERDTGSSIVQIVLLTQRIKELSDHLKTNKKDISSRRGLVKIVDKRRKLLEYIKKNNPKMYDDAVTKAALKK